MKIKPSIKVLALAFAVTAISSSIGYAQRGGRGEFGGGPPGGGFGRLFAALNLTSAQQTQINQITERYRQNFAPPSQEDRQDPFEALGNGTFDETAVRAAAEARAAKFVEMEVARARMLSEMYAVLTAEQKTQLAQIKSREDERRQQFQQSRQATDGAMPPPPPPPQQ